MSHIEILSLFDEIITLVCQILKKDKQTKVAFLISIIFKHSPVLKASSLIADDV